jgi:hypothetical protein
MEILSWRELDFPGVILAGLVAGYVMALAGLWAGNIPGLVAIDIADFGRRYMVSDSPVAWLVGVASHLINSVLLIFLWASVVEPNLFWPRSVEGLVWGLFLAAVFAGALVAPVSGLGFMGWRTGNARFAATNVLLHALWGAVAGMIYVPR